MKNTYPRYRPVSGLERLFARLVKKSDQATRPAIRVDLVHGPGVEFRQA